MRLLETFESFSTNSPIAKSLEIISEEKFKNFLIECSLVTMSLKKSLNTAFGDI